MSSFTPGSFTHDDKVLGTFTIHFKDGMSVKLSNVMHINAHSFNSGDIGALYGFLSENGINTSVVKLNIERTEWIPNE